MILEQKTDAGNKEIGATFIVDSVAEMSYLPTTTSAGTGKYTYLSPVSIGSNAIVNNNGTIEYYMLFTAGWVKM